jgi:crotonobetaine/carnitine-CoA ligase
MQDRFGGALSYLEAHEQSLRWASAFRALAVVPGQTAATMVPNSCKSFLAWQGLAWCRAIEVPIHDQFRGDLLAHVLNDSGARLLVVDSQYVDRIAAVADKLDQLRTVVALGNATPASQEPPFDVVSEVDFVNGSTTLGRLADPEPHDIAAVLYTSGTTGASKGVMLPWPAVYSAGIGTCPLANLASADVFYHMGTSSHIGAKAFPFLMALAGGQILVREVFSKSQFWADVDRVGATVTALYGSMSHFLMNEPASERDNQHALRKVLMAPLPPWLEAFNARFGVRTKTTYGMTELPPPIGGSFDLDDYRSCGRQIGGFPGYQLRLVDENDYEVRNGQVGELIVRSAQPWSMNVGYLNNPAATAEAWRNGWFHTGDAMRRDSDGRYYFIDRTKDVIRRSGENISSAEVEAAINQCDGVAESAVIAVPADSGIEDEVLAVIVPRSGSRFEPEALIDFLAPRIPRFMLPRYIACRTGLPKTATLRVKKAELRGSDWKESAWDRLSSSDWRPPSKESR